MIYKYLSFETTPNPLLFFFNEKLIFPLHSPLSQIYMSDILYFPFLPPKIKMDLSIAMQPNFDLGDFKFVSYSHPKLFKLNFKILLLSSLKPPIT